MQNKANPSGTNCRTGLLAFSGQRQDEEKEFEKTKPICRRAELA